MGAQRYANDAWSLGGKALLQAAAVAGIVQAVFTATQYFGSIRWRLPALFCSRTPAPALVADIECHPFAFPPGYDTADRWDTYVYATIRNEGSKRAEDVELHLPAAALVCHRS